VEVAGQAEECIFSISHETGGGSRKIIDIWKIVISIYV